MKMARIRTIKPDFFYHHGLFEAERLSGLPVRLAFIGLWTVADRVGRFRWVPPALKASCLPYDDVDMPSVLAALLKYGFLVQYGPDGRFGWIPGFTKHQRPNNKEVHSQIPAPGGEIVAKWAENFELSGLLDPEKAGLYPQPGEGKGREGKGTNSDGEICHTAPGES